MATSKKRINLYIDKGILDDAQKVADELDISLSAMTRALYLTAIGINNGVKEMTRWGEEIEAKYPEGVPLEEAQVFTDTFQRIINTQIQYIAGFLAGSEAKGFEKQPEVMDFKQMVQESSESLKGLSKIIEIEED